MQRGLTQTASCWPAIRAAYTCVFRAAHILTNDDHAPAEEVQRRYALVLDEMRNALNDPITDVLVKTWYAIFLKVTASYGPALFCCYDFPKLPRTNNDLEHLFGSVRYHERRASGRKQVAPTLLLRGQARVLASVSTRLHPVQTTDLPPANVTHWQALRRVLEQRQETRRQQRRFRQDADRYLLALEGCCEQVSVTYGPQSDQ